MFNASPLILLIDDDKTFGQLMLAHLDLKRARVQEADSVYTKHYCIGPIWD